MNSVKPRVLIIDDTPSARESLEDLLFIEGYELLFAENGREGIEKAEQHLPDLILLDVMMPGMDGFETCRKIRGITALSEIPILLLTALDDKDSMMEGIQAGADDFLTKPFDRQLLRLRIRTIIRLNRFKKISTERHEKEEAQQFLKKEQELNQLKSQFISMVSHEFRTPLAAINFTASFLQKYAEKLSKEQQQQKLSKIITQVNHMERLMNDVLAIGRTEAGKVRAHFQVFDFDAFIQPVIEEVAESFHFSHEIAYSKPQRQCKLNLDEQIGKEIFRNLLSNAIKFSPEEHKIEIEARLSGEVLQVEVKDYGIGIPNSDLKELFTPFHRGKNVSTIQGTGLGLKIVKDAVEIHKGEILVRSKENEGSSFIVKLPCLLQPDPKAEGNNR